jgi:phosphohistidine phosphatase
MRQIWLLRHAKSSWDDPGLPDEDRPLAPRGNRDASTMASYLASVDPPRLVLCSAGLRARQTLAAVLPSLGSPLRVAIEPELYTFDSRVVVERLRRLDDAGSSVMIVGHNPALEDLALWLSAEGALRERLGAKFPTAALAEIDLPDAPWRSLGEGVGTLARFVVPKELASGNQPV